MAKFRIRGEVIEAGDQQEAIQIFEEKQRVGEMGAGQRFATGAGRAVLDTGQKIGNMIPGVGRIAPDTFSDEAVQRQHRLHEPLNQTLSGGYGQFAGDLAALAPVGGAGRAVLGKTLGALGGVGQKALANPWVRNTLEGAIIGGTAAQPGEKLGGASEGAVWGTALPAAGKALSKIANPLDAVQEAKDLIARKVNLSAGQMNPDSYIGQLEKALQSVGLMGGKLAKRRAEPVGQFYREVATDAGPPGFKATDGDRDSLVKQLQDAYGLSYQDAIRAYTQLEPVIKNAAADVPLGPRQLRPGQPKAPGILQEQTKGGYPGTFVTNQDRARAGQNINNQLTGVGERQTSGEELQSLRSNLRTAGRDQATEGERAISKRAADKVTQAIESQIDPADAVKLREIDARYPGMLVFKDAARAAGDRPWPTPFQLSKSVKGVASEGDYSVGQGPLRDMARRGARVFADAPETGARQVTVGKFPATKATALVGLNQVPSEVLAGMTPWQRKIQAQMDALRQYDMGPIRGLVPAFGMAGDE